jgi:hypothetical protein
MGGRISGLSPRDINVPASSATTRSLRPHHSDISAEFAMAAGEEHASGQQLA